VYFFAVTNLLIGVPNRIRELKWGKYVACQGELIRSRAIANPFARSTSHGDGFARSEALFSGVAERLFLWDAGGIFTCPDTDSFSALCQNCEKNSHTHCHFWACPCRACCGVFSSLWADVRRAGRMLDTPPEARSKNTPTWVGFLDHKLGGRCRDTAPHPHGLRDAPRCGALSVLQKPLHYRGGVASPLG
jgi:hypothetical protein